MTFKTAWIIASFWFLCVWIGGDLVFKDQIRWINIMNMEIGLAGGIWVCYLNRDIIKWQ